MTKPLFVTCNHCGDITNVSFKEKHHKNGIKETYFKCNQCQYHYTSFVTDKTVRKMQRKTARLRSNISNKSNTNASDELLELQKKINQRMSRLKDDLLNRGEKP